MKNPKVYLSGPMDHVDEEEGKGWRERAKELLSDHGITVFDPYDFEQDVDTPKLLVKADLTHIIQSHGMIINASQDVIVWGSPMETLWAWQNGIMNVAFTGTLHASPWLSAHASIVATLDQAVENIAWKLSRL